MRPHEVDAWRLDWDNMEELAQMVRGRAHQRITLDRKTGDQKMLGWIEFGEGDTYQVLAVGNYLVKEATGDWKVWVASVFETAFEPASEVLTLPAADA